MHRHGRGIWKGRWTQYEGQFQDDHQHGHGSLTWSDGRSYDGQFEFSKFSGRGRMVWKTDKGIQTYEGEYKDDLKHGHGKFMWADSRIYDGQWENGKRHGKGLYIDAKGRRKFGEWSYDKFEAAVLTIVEEEPQSEAAPVSPTNDECSILDVASGVIGTLEKVLVYAIPNLTTRNAWQDFSRSVLSFCWSCDSKLTRHRTYSRGRRPSDTSASQSRSEPKSLTISWVLVTLTGMVMMMMAMWMVAQFLRTKAIV
jgi:hypothetical protein